VKLLLDTHAFLWWIADDSRLSSRAAAVIADGENEVWVSAASAWEIAIKSGLGRLEVPDPVDRFVPAQLRANGFLSLPISLRHALATSDLPDGNRDPFDRMLAAQAITEELTLVTGDRALQGLPVTWEW